MIPLRKKLAIFLLAIGLALRFVLPVIEVSIGGVAAQKDSLPEYEFVTNEQELPSLVGVEFNHEDFILTLSDGSITLPLGGRSNLSDLSFRAVRDDRCVEKSEQKWQIDYPSSGGEGSLNIIWKKGTFLLAHTESGETSVYTRKNNFAVDVLLDGGKASLRNSNGEIGGDPADILPVEELSPTHIFYFNVTAIDNQGCNLRLEFDGLKYGILKEKLVTSVSAKKSADVNSSSVAWYILGGIVGFVVFIGISAGIYCFIKYPRKNRKARAAGKSVDNPVFQPDAVVVPPSSGVSSDDCPNVTCDDNRVANCTDTAAEVDSKMLSDAGEPEKKPQESKKEIARAILHNKAKMNVSKV